MTDGLCGRDRPGHFRGVTTVVTILFNIVLPDVAVFGQKDAQQAFVLRRMTRYLFLLPEIVIAPTVRHENGLAMSSRNKYLTPDERQVAPALRKALDAAETAIASGEKDTKVIRSAMEQIINKSGMFTIDYIEMVDTDRLQPVDSITGETLIAVAAKLGRARRIDNTVVRG